MLVTILVAHDSLDVCMLPFSAYGPIAEVKLHKKCGYGFVRYEQHQDAVRAIVENHGQVVHGRVSWCRVLCDIDLQLSWPWCIIAGAAVLCVHMVVQGATITWACETRRRPQEHCSASRLIQKLPGWI